MKNGSGHLAAWRKSQMLDLYVMVPLLHKSKCPGGEGDIPDKRCSGNFEDMVPVIAPSPFIFTRSQETCE